MVNNIHNLSPNQDFWTPGTLHQKDEDVALARTFWALKDSKYTVEKSSYAGTTQTECKKFIQKIQFGDGAKYVLTHTKLRMYTAM